MVKIYIQKSSAFIVRIAFVLLCLVLFNSALKLKHSSNSTRKRDFYSGIPKPTHKEVWNLAPLGKSAYEFLSLFFIFSHTGAVRTTLETGVNDSSVFWKSVIGHTFLQQIPMTITISFGLLGVCLLFLMPCFILLYRNRQIAASEETEVDSAVISPKQGWLIYEFLIVLLAVSAFGGVIMSISVVRFNDDVDQFFNLGIEVINLSYNLKQIISYNYYYSLYDVSRSSFDAIQLMYDVNDDIGAKFMNSTNYLLKAVNYFARSLQWDATDAQNTLKELETHVESMINGTDSNIKSLLAKYTEELNKLKKVFDAEKASNIFGSVLDPLLKLPDYNSSNFTTENYNKSISKFENLLTLDFQKRLQNFSHYIDNLVSYPNYDPSKIMGKLKEITFLAEEKIRNEVGTYVSYLEVNFTEKDKAQALKEIGEAKHSTTEFSHKIQIIVLIFGIVSVALTLFYFVAFTVGVIGTSGYRLKPSGVSVHKSALSNGSGKILVIFLYVGAIFLALFWAVSLLVFVLSSVPVEICIASKSKSIFDLSIDNKEFRGKKHWYGMYSSPQFNSSLKEGLEICKKDETYFPALADPIVESAPFENLKTQLDTYTVKDVIDKGVTNMPYTKINESELSTANLSDVLDLNTHAYFKDILDFTQALVDTNASTVLNELKTHTKSSAALRGAAESATNSYKTIAVFLSNTAALEDVFNTTLRSLDISVKNIITQFDLFVLSYDHLVNYIQTNASAMYMKLLNESVVNMIDGVHFNLNYTTLAFRKSVSYCPYILIYYDKYVSIICEDIVYPVSACWFGSFFVDICLVLAVFLILYSVTLFLKPPNLNSSDLPPAFVRPEDIPNALDRNNSVTSALYSSEDSKDTPDEKDDASAASTSVTTAAIASTKTVDKPDEDDPGSETTADEPGTPEASPNQGKLDEKSAPATSSPHDDSEKNEELHNDSASEITPETAAVADSEMTDELGENEPVPKDNVSIAAAEKADESDSKSDISATSASSNDENSPNTASKPVAPESTEESSANDDTDRIETDTGNSSTDDKSPLNIPTEENLEQRKSIKDML